MFICLLVCWCFHLLLVNLAGVLFVCLFAVCFLANGMFVRFCLFVYCLLSLCGLFICLCWFVCLLVGLLVSLAVRPCHQNPLWHGHAKGFVCLRNCVFDHLFVYLMFVYLTSGLFVCLFVCLSVCLFAVCLFSRSYVCLFTCLFIRCVFI